MQTFLSPWKAACRPFITRVFRGSRLKVALLLSTALTLLSLLLGFSTALSSGSFARELRTELGFERSLWDRRDQEFTVFADSPETREQLLAARRQFISDGPLPDHGRVYPDAEFTDLAFDGYQLLRAATMVAAPPEHRPLSDDAAALLWSSAAWWSATERNVYLPSFSWQESNDVTRLRAVVAHQGLPGIELYASPLDFRAALGVVGLGSSVIFVVAFLMIAPLLAAVALAQEVHENTLQPLVGTALSPRQLAVGLRCASLAQAGLYAAPQAGVILLCLPWAAQPFAIVLGLVATVVVGVCLTVLAQLAGLAMGRKWAPGIVAMALSGVLGVALCIAFLVAAELRAPTFLGLIAAFPQVGPLLAFLEGFRVTPVETVFDLPRLSFHVVAAAIVFTIVLFVGARALERRLAGRTQPSLSLLEHGLASAAVVFVSLLVFPSERVVGRLYIASLMFALPPLWILSMGRVPLGERPGPIEAPWLGRAAGLYGFGLALHFVGVLVLGGAMPCGAIPWFHLSWTFLVGFAVAVSTLAHPLTAGRSVRAGLALLMLAVEYGTAAATGLQYGDSPWFPIIEVSPMLALLQIGALIVLPIVYVRDLWPRRSPLRAAA